MVIEQAVCRGRKTSQLSHTCGSPNILQCKKVAVAFPEGGGATIFQTSHSASNEAGKREAVMIFEVSMLFWTQESSGYLGISYRELQKIYVLILPREDWNIRIWHMRPTTQMQSQGSRNFKWALLSFSRPRFECVVLTRNCNQKQITVQPWCWVHCFLHYWPNIWAYLLINYYQTTFQPGKGLFNLKIWPRR